MADLGGTARRRAALVTGASSGIGAQFAHLLAARGYDLILVARGVGPLDALSAELAATHATSCRVVPADLSTDEGLGRVETLIGEVPALDVVINNAGFGWRGQFTEQPVEIMREMIGLNVLALSVLARRALSVMKARRAGNLLNVSSVAGFMPGPSAAEYHASKAYVTSLTEALHEEARPFGVHVVALCPGVTPTGFQRRAGTEHSHVPRFATTSATRVAAEGLRALDRNQTICVPGAAYKTIAMAVRLGPRAVVRGLAGKFIRNS